MGYTVEIQRQLEEPFPEAWVQQKTLKGNSIDFVPWWRYAARLDEIAPGEWSMGTPLVNEVGGKLIVLVPVTIFGVTRVNGGDEESEHEGYGSAVTNAFAQAFKRSCAMFGLGRYLYQKDRPRNPSRTPPKSAVRQEGPPPHVMAALDLEEDARPQSEPVPSCPICDGAMWDNRENKRNPKAPDFKCKDKGCDGALWRRKKAGAQ